MSTVKRELPQAKMSADIWTQDVGKSFYTNIYALDKKLGKYSARQPQDYRNGSIQPSDSDYTLSYEKELHIADHFAFLAHAKEQAECVSAVTLEEFRNPPSLTVRLASNKTPTTDVTDGLRKILHIIKEHACEGVYLTLLV